MCFFIYPAQVETWPERPNDIVGQIRLLCIPDESNRDDLRTVEEHAANLDALTTVALWDVTDETKVTDDVEVGGPERSSRTRCFKTGRLRTVTFNP